MNNNTGNLLKKINYIEAEIEIQKQILYSVSSSDKEEIEKILRVIAAKKDEIAELRNKIKIVDPEEFNRIKVFEKAVQEFRKLAATTPFQSISSQNADEPCILSLQNGSSINCLVKACDENGDWTIITFDGEIRQFKQSEVNEKPELPVISH
ncbi:hypothetical protein [Desulfomarina sp.]